MPSGGSRTPNTPAMVSGPGSLSARTDGGVGSKQAQRYIAGGDYGDGGLLSLQQGAPMAKTLGGTSAPQDQGQQAQGPQVTPLTQPSERPNEPVTSGATAGAGPGPEALNLQQPAQTQYMVNALSLLNQLGDSVSPQVKQIRNSIAAHLNNQSGK